jgi:predicted nucleotidyltransferase
MGGKEDLMEKIRKFKEKISENIRIDEMLIFGSFARGDMKEDSDIDIILVSRDFSGVKPMKRSVKLYMLWDLPYPVDFICYTPEEFERLKNKPSIVREALEEGIAV